MNKIILASASPRRKDLLKLSGIDFIVDASSIDEVLDLSLSLEERLMKLAADKAYPIHEKYPDDIVLGADTIVYYNQQIIGKAKDVEDAKRILTMLSSDKHTVYTAVALYNKDELITFIDKTDVYFKDITSMINDYLSLNEWQGKAGAYGIQDSAKAFVDYIDGDLDNVIGLPVYRVKEVLKNIGKI